MASIKTKLAVGVFVLIGFAIAFMAVIWLGMSSQFEKGHYHVAYFDESVQGLSKDSPVKYRGVAVGRVESIRVAPDTTLIEVILKIETDLNPDDHMSAQLRSVGITGIMFVELDRRKPGEPDMSPKLSFKPEYPVVATKPSEISRIIHSFDNALKQIGTLDLGGITRKVQTVLDRIDTAVTNLEVQALSREIRMALNGWNQAVASVRDAGRDFSQLTRRTETAVGSIENAIHGIDAVVTGSGNDFKQILAGIQQSVGSADAFLKEGTALVRQGRVMASREGEQLSGVMDDLARAMENLGRASGNLNRLVEEVENHPSRILFGRPPPARDAGPED
jgi:phospholipid/cholesterol/gamma-HCH transport system substrate-binding protein